MSYETVPGKPVLHAADPAETEQARRLLDRYGIDFEARAPMGPGVVLEWNGVIYKGLFGVADFVMFAGRLPVPGLHRSGRSGDGRPVGAPASLL